MFNRFLLWLSLQSGQHKTLGGNSTFVLAVEGTTLRTINSSNFSFDWSIGQIQMVFDRYEHLGKCYVTGQNKGIFYTDTHWAGCPNRIHTPYMAKLVDSFFRLAALTPVINPNKTVSIPQNESLDSFPPTLALANIPIINVGLKTPILEALVDWIEHTPYFLFRIRNGSVVRSTQIVKGWDERLRLYSYARNNKDSDYVKDYSETCRLHERAHKLAHMVSYNWKETDRINAVKLAKDIFIWGGVEKGKAVTPNDVENVFKRAVGLAAPAPMNSRWTKVAAFASGRNGQAIWDSRVSSSVIWRLDQILKTTGKGDPQSIFPNIGCVPGQGGTRKGNWRSYHAHWPSGYGSWASQDAATRVIKEIRDILNANGKYPQMPIPNGTGAFQNVIWDVWGVAQVLFMDGY